MSLPPSPGEADAHINLLHPDLPQGGGVRAGTLVSIRWVAVAGQALSLLFVSYGLGFHVRLDLTLPLVALSALLNLVLHVRLPRNSRLTELNATLQLGFDLLHLAALVYLTGGLANPFAVLLLAPTSVSASMLGRRSTILLVLLSLILLTCMAFTPFPLPWDGPPPDIPRLYLVGLWVGLAFAMVFLAAYTARVGREGRHRARALSATQIALEREQQLSALGALAAAAAHELGTPLGTITMTVSDLRDAARDSNDAFAAQALPDLDLIAQQTRRCRDILTRISQQGRTGSEDHFRHISLETLVREAGAPLEHAGVTLHYGGDPQARGMAVLRRSEQIHALRNIVENAVSFAASRVDIEMGMAGDRVDLRISDDGPGFDPTIVRQLGEPYVSHREGAHGETGGLGLGLFIAKTLLERTGGKVRFERAPGGGAQVRVAWQRADLIAPRQEPQKAAPPATHRTGTGDKEETDE
ncbi:ActS/PrrB/RegB family redox-sensitive histidine kinase [Yunchengibacter salinarum]|uniref:ActS/PrrB/RegB family redox-sensitive histidine kinase n=1 Tax=Yunchengibacter salinarum TaxID=3133399 RepID=UPI0035B5C5F0